jgi:hypothetical protein
MQVSRWKQGGWNGWERNQNTETKSAYTIFVWKPLAYSHFKIQGSSVIMILIWILGNCSPPVRWLNCHKTQDGCLPGCSAVQSATALQLPPTRQPSWSSRQNLKCYLAQDRFLFLQAVISLQAACFHIPIISCNSRPFCLPSNCKHPFSPALCWDKFESIAELCNTS